MNDPFMNPPKKVWPDSPRKIRLAELKREVMTEEDARRAARGMHEDYPAPDVDYDGQLRELLTWFSGQPTLTEDECWRCEQTRWGVWCLYRKSNGNQLVRLLCLACGTKMQDRGYRASDGCLPIWRDGVNTTPCARCGDRGGVEEHHWAPKHLFEDAYEWPTSMLCPSCHREWHRIVTPNMHRKATA